MKITVVGTGYVGLVTGTCFSDVGIDVTCVDIDKEKIENLEKGIIPIYEPGLEEMVKDNINKGRLHFSTEVKNTLKDTEVIFSAVGTPPDEDGSADLQYVLDVAREVGRHMQNYLILVTKSTVPVGTAKKVKAVLQEELDKRGSNLDFDVASNPEFLKEGSAVQDFLKPDRIVVGTESEKAENIMAKLYKPFTLNGHPIIFMNVPSAEVTKYAANAMLATKISFMNDIANFCEVVDADVNMVRKGIGSDSRIGNKFIYPGTGYGGSCFPKDVKAIIQTANENDYNLKVLQSVEEVNEEQKSILFRKLMDYYDGDIKGKKIGMWGLSFKPKTDDMRESPALTLIDKITEAGGKITAYDPVAMDEAKRRVGDKIQYAKDQYDALMDADAMLMVTEWMDFRYPNFNVIKRIMKTPAIFDGRNIYDPLELKKYGFYYTGIGIADNED